MRHRHTSSGLSYRSKVLVTLTTAMIGMATSVGSTGPIAAQADEVALRAPVTGGTELEVIHGYDDPIPGEMCSAGSAPDHCRNQRYGLDLRVIGPDDGIVRAPVSGSVAWEDVGGTGCIGLSIPDGLNLNLCHLANLDTPVGESVAQGEPLGMRSTDWIHMSLDDRRRPGDPEPVAFDGLHAIEGRALPPMPDVERSAWTGTVFTSSNAAPIATLDVVSWEENRTGIRLVKGQTVLIEASGRWCSGGIKRDGTASCGGPEGIRPPDPGEVYDLILDDEPIGLLIGSIGGRDFPIGDKAALEAPASGILTLLMNDRSCCFSDNDGAITVTVSAIGAQE